jgi:hypothetical protein
MTAPGESVHGAQTGIVGLGMLYQDHIQATLLQSYHNKLVPIRKLMAGGGLWGGATPQKNTPPPNNEKVFVF